MIIQKFIETAIEGGWKPPRNVGEFIGSETDLNLCMFNNPDTNYVTLVPLYEIVLDPEVWKAVYKVKRGGEKERLFTNGFMWIKTDGEWKVESDQKERPEWQMDMAGMIDALCEGTTLEEYLETL